MFLFTFSWWKIQAPLKVFNKIKILRKVKSRPEDTKKIKVIGKDAASKLFNEEIGKLDDEYNEL